MRAGFVIFLILMVTSSLCYGFEETRTLTLSADNIETLAIQCGGGSLEISGVEDQQQIDVEAVIIIENVDAEKVQEILDKHLNLSLAKQGTKAVLTSVYEDRDRSFFSFFGDDALVNVDLTVTIPRIMNLDIDDGSGWMSIRDVFGNLELNDGSGDVEIRNLKGNADIKDGSGGFDLREVLGQVTIEDGSGELQIHDVTGNVAVDDGSGELDISKIKGSVEVRDGSGDIRVSRISKDVIIHRSGSGGVSIHDVEGEVRRYD